MTKKNILMICYYFPPLTDVGAKRSVAFAKYFKKHGWSPYVLTVKNPDKTYCSLGDEKAPGGIKVERSYSIANVYKFFGKLNGLLSRLLKPFGIDLKRNYFYDIFCIPDFFGGWIPLTTLKGYNLIRKWDIDIIYVSCTPISSAIIGVVLRLLTGKPLVLDFRDPFALKNLSFLGVPKLRRHINRSIEEFLLSHTDIFIVTTKETQDAYIKQYPYIKNNIYTIHNGVDDEILTQVKVKKYPKFTIIYAGEFYFYNAFSYSIFFEAIYLLKRSGKIDHNNFQFLFYGDGKDEIEQIAKEHNIEDVVQANSRIPYKDILNVISKSHLQFIRIISYLTISVKLLEGIPLNVPFLATIPAGEAEEIIKKYSPSSYIITDESAHKVAEAIADTIAKYDRDEIKDNRVREFLEDFSREKLTLKLMKIIKERVG